MKLQNHTFTQATKELDKIKHLHGTFENGLRGRWKQRKSDNEPTAQSVLWLYCWALDTDVRSKSKAAQEAKIAFDQFKPEGRNFKYFESHISQEFARRHRYNPNDIESKVKSLL